jgi:hypothetical protein
MSLYTKPTNFIVYNINGNLPENYRENDYLINKYREVTNSTIKICANAKCTNTNLVGAYVQIEDNKTSGTWYTAPLCKNCTIVHHGNFITLNANIILVSYSTQSNN